MDPYKLLGVPEAKIKHPSDLVAVRSKAKKLYKRYVGEKNKFDAKKVLEAFDMVKQNLGGRLGEGDKKILGRSRMERMMDKHYNHQTKEIKNDKNLKKALKKARKGDADVMHLPGDKERVPTGRGYKMYKRRRRHRHHRSSRRLMQKKQVECLAGLQRLAVVLPFESKFPKAVKLLHRWMKEYMNTDNREFVFEVLQDIVDLHFLLDETEARQDVLITFEYVLNYFKAWFAEGDNEKALGSYWQVAGNLASRCFTDDAFTLSSTLSKLTEALTLLESYRDDLKDGVRFEDDYGGVAPAAKRQRRLREMSLQTPLPEASPGESIEDGASDQDCDEGFDEDDEEEEELDEAIVKTEDGVKLEKGTGIKTKKDEDVKDEKFGVEEAGDSKAEQKVKDELPREVGPAPGPTGPIELADSSEEGEAGGVKAEAIDIDSAEESVKDEEISLSSGDSSDEESIEVMSDVEGSVFPVPPAIESLYRLRAHFVDRCLATLFQNRGPLWARPKIDAFFQDLFYRRSIFAEDQRLRIEAWQSRIKTNQKLGVRDVGVANNPMEAHRPVVDAREMKTVIDSDTNAWAAKQTFDSRESSGGRNVIR